MKSIKPGRGSSAMGALGSIIASLFGIFWIVMAVEMGAPAIMPIFGILFVIAGIVSAIYNYKNATGKKRYSTYDITDDGEEEDPLQARFGESQKNDSSSFDAQSTSFCPYCGTRADSDYMFCKKCGKKLP